MAGSNGSNGFILGSAPLYARQYADARSNLESAQADSAYHKSEFEAAEKQLEAFPARERGLAFTTARNYAIVLTLIDVPAMWLTAQALRAPSYWESGIMTLAAATFNSVFAWQIGRQFRYRRDSEGNTFHEWFARVGLVVLVAWLAMLFGVRANAAAPWGLNPALLAGLLTMLACGVALASLALGHGVESSEVAEVRSKSLWHKRQWRAIQKDVAEYNQDLQRARAASGLPYEPLMTPRLPQAEAPPQMALPGPSTNGSHAAAGGMADRDAPE
jgi:hypothetical protein